MVRALRSIRILFESGVDWLKVLVSLMVTQKIRTLSSLRIVAPILVRAGGAASSHAISPKDL